MCRNLRSRMAASPPTNIEQEAVSNLPVNCRILSREFTSMTLDEKQDAVEKMFSSTRRKMHPLIRMDDLLDPRKSSTVQNIVSNMQKLAMSKKSNMWYNVPVALDRERHTSSFEGWQGLMSKLEEFVTSFSSISLPLRWQIDLFPATDNFIVDHVINEGCNFRKPRTFLMDTQEAMEAASALGIGGRKIRPPMHHEPIYHMYLECTFQGQEDQQNTNNREHMDVMYSRWAVQNPMLLRQRILERMGTEFLVEESKSRVTTSNPRLCST